MKHPFRNAALLALVLLGCSSPTAPTLTEFIPGFVGHGTGELANGNVPGPGRASWVPIRFERLAQLESVTFRTGPFVGRPGAPEAQVLVATLTDATEPGRIVYASAVLPDVRPNESFTVSGIRFRPELGQRYVVGVLVMSPGSDAENYVTLRIWDDPRDAEQQLAVSSSGGDSPRSAGFASADEPDWWGYEVGQAWRGNVVSYVIRPLALWLTVAL